MVTTEDCVLDAGIDVVMAVEVASPFEGTVTLAAVEDASEGDSVDSTAGEVVVLVKIVYKGDKIS